MPNPESPEQVAIYDFSAVRQGGPFGGAPGDGNAVIASRHSQPGGPLTFFRLDTLRSGDAIEMVYGGSRLNFTVVVACNVPPNAFEPFVRRTQAAVLTLITDARDNARTVIVAERDAGSLPRACPGGTPL